MRSVSIEYAHIYTVDKIGDEQNLSLDILGRLKQDYLQAQKTTALAVLIDDYSFPDPAFDYKTFLAWLESKGFKPDIVFRESQLIPVCDKVLKILRDDKQRNELAEYIRTKKYPCSLFIAAWYLLRLGYLSHNAFDTELSANGLINILPISFQPFEEKALEIMATTSYPDSARRVEYRYFNGRSLVAD